MRASGIGIYGCLFFFMSIRIDSAVKIHTTFSCLFPPACARIYNLIDDPPTFHVVMSVMLRSSHYCNKVYLLTCVAVRFSCSYLCCFLLGGRDVTWMTVTVTSSQNNAPAVGNKRTLRLRLDPAQYHADMKAADMVYETVNLLIRRSAKENNFKGILETIR